MRWYSSRSAASLASLGDSFARASEVGFGMGMGSAEGGATAGGGSGGGDGGCSMKRFVLTTPGPWGCCASAAGLEEEDK